LIGEAPERSNDTIRLVGSILWGERKPNKKIWMAFFCGILMVHLSLMRLLHAQWGGSILLVHDIGPQFVCMGCSVQQILALASIQTHQKAGL
jgi:hypothetical protein